MLFYSCPREDQRRNLPTVLIFLPSVTVYCTVNFPFYHYYFSNLICPLVFLYFIFLLSLFFSFFFSLRHSSLASSSKGMLELTSKHLFDPMETFLPLDKFLLLLQHHLILEFKCVGYL